MVVDVDEVIHLLLTFLTGDGAEEIFTDEIIRK